METKKELAIAAVALVLVLGLMSLAAIAKNDNAKSNSSKNNKTENTQKANFKNFEKADRKTGKTNAQVHREKSQAVIRNLNQVMQQEQSIGNLESGAEIQSVVREQMQNQEQTAQAIEDVEKRGRIKTFLVGTDYKNLGQLRSSLVHNRNEIRKLTRTITQVQATGGDAAALQLQLATLMQERERIKEVIVAHETEFSLLGWVVRFLTGYEKTPINDTEEEQLTEEVADAIGETPTDGTVVPDDSTIPGNTAPVTPGSTVPVQ